MKIFIILCFTFVGINSLSNYEDEWTNFKLRYGKEFKMRGEENFRKAIFNSNLQKIEEHNKLYEQGLETYSMEINKFADLHHREFNKLYKGFKNSKMAKSSTNQIPFVSSSNDIPDSIDWRAFGAVTGVKDQMQCGSCWAFSSTGALEGQLFRKTGNLISISEQNLVDCSKDFFNDGCNGGFMEGAFKYVIHNKGIDSEKSYPYEGRDGKCTYEVEYNVTSASGIVSIKEGDENELKIAVGTAGPVSVAIDANHQGFAFYKEGIYYEKSCKNNDESLDHAVLVVGYGTENDVDYWLVKNSWGNGWGEHGYIKMARNRDNHCGIAATPSYPLI